MMKRLIAITIAITMLTLCASAMAVSWSNPIPGATPSAFSVEVLKLKARTDATGARYYTELEGYETYTDNTIYYCIKLTIPPYREANAYYKTGDLYSGSSVKVVIDYTNVANKDRDVAYATLTDQPQTLYYNGTSFVPVMGHNYVLSAIQVQTGSARISASVVGKGTLEDIVIGNSYKVKQQAYYGVQPCVNCNRTTLIGYLVYGAHAAHDIFLSVSNGKLSGVYVIDQYESASYGGAKVKVDQPLYRWVQNGLYTGFDGREYPSYGLQELFFGVRIDKHAGALVEQKSDGYFQQYCNAFAVKQELRDVNGVYYLDADGMYRRVTGQESFWRNASYFYEDNGAYVQYSDSDALFFGNIYYDVAAYTETAIHQMTSPYHVNDDSYEKDYLNSANHVLNLLGLTFSDIGVAYMSDDLWLQNFGFSASQNSTADWTYTAKIVTIPVAEVPATGDNLAGRMASLFFGVAALAALFVMFRSHRHKH